MNSPDGGRTFNKWRNMRMSSDSSVVCKTQAQVSSISENTGLLSTQRQKAHLTRRSIAPLSLNPTFGSPQTMITSPGRSKSGWRAIGAISRHSGCAWTSQTVTVVSSLGETVISGTSSMMMRRRWHRDDEARSCGTGVRVNGRRCVLMTLVQYSRENDHSSSL